VPADPRRLALYRLALFAVLLLAVFLAVTVTGSFPSAQEVRDWGEGLGAIGPPAFIVGAAVANSLFVLPGPVAAGASGLLFGTALGTGVSLLSATLAAAIQLLVARYLAGDQVGAILPDRVRRVDEFIERRGFWAVFYVRMAPGVPYTLVNYGAGLTRLRLRHMVGGTLVGAAPRTFAYTALGGSLTDLSAPEAKVAVGLLIVMAVVGALLARRQILAERAGREEPDAA
jgi:uncharacterized membrane protein YdjX (TVP38/TMEM64 family)